MKQNWLMNVKQNEKKPVQRENQRLIASSFKWSNFSSISRMIVPDMSDNSFHLTDFRSVLSRSYSNSLDGITVLTASFGLSFISYQNIKGGIIFINPLWGVKKHSRPKPFHWPTLVPFILYKVKNKLEQGRSYLSQKLSWKICSH